MGHSHGKRKMQERKVLMVQPCPTSQTLPPLRRANGGSVTNRRPIVPSLPPAATHSRKSRLRTGPAGYELGRTGKPADHSKQRSNNVVSTCGRERSPTAATPEVVGLLLLAVIVDSIRKSVNKARKRRRVRGRLHSNNTRHRRGGVASSPAQRESSRGDIWI